MTAEAIARSEAPCTTVAARREAVRAVTRVRAANRPAVALSRPEAIRRGSGRVGDHRGVEHDRARKTPGARP